MFIMTVCEFKNRKFMNQNLRLKNSQGLRLAVFKYIYSKSYTSLWSMVSRISCLYKEACMS